ncbi:putative PurR-regulated permease PerM [Anaerosolibacter carboniphilus]|uniref:Putative PurR-regulated permease PerM n=1 Tax=Anaerosolibacter carboniphilus TaxID=1417629 RepID=A0A841L3U4_9FIRM|nr:AI-2E family transporter [Anaerosolibacter carboniphilus]MBB6218840.1 putative PurR-regulated permease PerM [Anaerosolibacter carboniphilus]
MPEFRKIPYLRFVPVLLIAFIMFKLVNHPDIIWNGLDFFLSIISPLIWAFAIAYLLNPMMVYFEKRFGIKRIWSILVIYMFFLGITILGITIISPRIIKSISELLAETPRYIARTETQIETWINEFKLFDTYGVASVIEQNTDAMIQNIRDYIDLLLTSALSSIIGFTSGLFDLIIGLIISIYLLKDKESFIQSIKRFLYAFMKKEKAEGLITFGNEVDLIFSQYIVGKFIDSFIIGILCFIGLKILNVPYPMLLSTIVGITNMIPYFGPIIGMIPAGIITLFASPIKALWVILFIFILQQFDGLWLGPKILGDKVGLSPFWIILAIIVGGGAFGVLGMFLAVPILAIIKTLLERQVDRRLQRKELDIQ